MERPPEKLSTELFWQSFHPRLSEAMFRIKEEDPEHPYREIAEEELNEIHEEALAIGITDNRFRELCDQAYNHQWQGEEDETFIETEEGDKIYRGSREFVVGEGQLPPDAPSSVSFLEKTGRWESR